MIDPNQYVELRTRLDLLVKENALLKQGILSWAEPFGYTCYQDVIASLYAKDQEIKRLKGVINDIVGTLENANYIHLEVE